MSERASDISARERSRRRKVRRARELVRAEFPYRERGIERLAGVDEAGVGPLANPVVAGAVIMPAEPIVRGAFDSKGLGEKHRVELAEEIRAVAVSWAVAAVRPREIDRINIYQATLVAMRRAVEKLRPAPEHVLVDARTIPQLAMPQEAHIKGDARFYHIACASILAKTHRDNYMIRMDRRYPGYGFAGHKGYPSTGHRDAIRKLGPCPIHRTSFRWLPEGDPNQQTLDALWGSDPGSEADPTIQPDPNLEDQSPIME